MTDVAHRLAVATQAAAADHGQVLASASEMSSTRCGESLRLRFIAPRDAEPLRRYFETMSPRLRYNRFLGATQGLSDSDFRRMLRLGEDGRFAVVAEIDVNGAPEIVSESRFAIAAESQRFEFGLSVAEAWQSRGVGAAVLVALERHATARGAVGMFADTFWTNEPMKGLARKAGYAFGRSPGDWGLVRVEKGLDRTAAGDPVRLLSPAAA